MGRGSRSGGGRSSFGGGRSSFSSGGRGSRSAPGRSFSGPSIHIGGHGHHHHYGYRSHRHVHVYGGSISPKAALIIFMVFFALTFGLIGFSSLSSIEYHQESIDIATADYNFYQDLIDNAYEHRNEGLIVQGEVVTSYYDYDVDKWYLIYTVPGLSKRFETFSVYTESEALQYSTGDPIEIALNKATINNTTETIDTNLRYVELEDFSLYVLASDALSEAKASAYIPLAVSVVMIAGIVFIAVKSFKSKEEGEASEPVDTTKEDNTITCKYCGALHDASKRKCSSCGASLRK